MKVTTKISSNMVTKVVDMSNEEYADVRMFGEQISKIQKIEDDMEKVKELCMSDEYRNADDVRKAALFNDLCLKMGYEGGNDFAARYELRHEDASKMLSKVYALINNLCE